MADEVQVFVLPTATRAKRTLGFGALFVATVATVAAGWGAVAWIAAGMTGIAFVATLLDLAFPGRLEVGARSFSVVGRWHRRRHRFARCSAFTVFDQPLGRGRTISWVTFDDDEFTPRSRLQRANAIAAGRNSMLKPAAFGLTGSELASILNRRRDESQG